MKIKDQIFTPHKTKVTIIFQKYILSFKQNILCHCPLCKNTMTLPIFNLVVKFCPSD